MGQLLTSRVTRTAVVGDSFVKDIKPAMWLGLKAIWLTQENAPRGTEVRVFRSLRDLCM
ncbi:hypothetical protein MARHY2278 [Marinobacter nauticus ATCC 49840]|nr:hypothetical protein MARHY2278 [Marinobacter nauticus ATCC 49840]